MKIILTSKGQEIFVDDEDYENLNQTAWHITTNGYVAHSVKVKGKTRTILMHRAILGLEKGEVKGNRLMVDHIDGVRFNNQKANLRIVTHQQNQWNTHTHSKNKTGYKGVVFDRSNKVNPYRAQIRLNGKHVGLGSFATVEAAHYAYIKAKAELHRIQ